MTGLVVDERGFGTEQQLVPWSDVEAVGIRTTSDGPWAEDVFWQFLLRDGRLIELPGMAVDGEQLSVLQTRLPGMDPLKIVAAMGSTCPRIFRVWHVEDSKGAWEDERFRARFTSLVERLGGHRAGAAETFERLRAAWSEKHRRYHDLEHLAECLRALDEAHPEPRVGDVAELALWFHDAVYRSKARDNEERSAALLLREAAGLEVPTEAAEEAAGCVRATAHLDASLEAHGPAATLVVDVDLSILGRDVLRFMEFEYAVEEEYAPVTSAFFVARGRFLASLLARPSIYRTRFFRDRYESAARAQIASLLQSPRYRAWRWLRWLWR